MTAITHARDTRRGIDAACRGLVVARLVAVPNILSRHGAVMPLHQCAREFVAIIRAMGKSSAVSGPA